ncbi:MAG: DUF1571 domain-containing protein [Planctomycetes bacterium]|nr:DUF1571 domain-containing protein [Planctomycetota bacterium]
MSSRLSRRTWICLLASSTALYTVAMAWGQEPRDQLKEPVFRVTKRIESDERKPNHPLDQAIKIAEDGLKRIRTEVADYTCTIVKQERIKGELLPTEHMRAEIRNRKTGETQAAQPFSVYLNFLKPDTIQGREVMYVEGKNGGKLVGHEAKGVEKLLGDVWLKPEGMLAMRGQRYPITEIGIENLVDKLIERATSDRKSDPKALSTQVRYIEKAKINGRSCLVIEVTHPVQKPYFDFHIARVFIDDQLQVPVRYAAYSWPTTPGGRPVLEEAYTYLDMKMNVGLKENDFDHEKRFRQIRVARQ